MADDYQIEQTAEAWVPEPTAQNLSTSEPVPVCPICGGLVRRRFVPFADSRDGRLRMADQGWRCDNHGPVTPDWVEPLEEDS